jgi:hypothetical protein
MKSRTLASGYHLPEGKLCYLAYRNTPYPEDGGINILWKFSDLPPDSAVSPRKNTAQINGGFHNIFKAQGFGG